MAIPSNKMFKEVKHGVFETSTGEQFTNHQRLPKEVVAAVMMDRYTDTTEEPWDYSASTLTTPIQLHVLKKRHKKRLKIFDVTDKFWSFFGSVAHQVLEDAWHEKMGSVPEERIYMTIHGKIISGKLDLYHQPEIRDYKTTKVYKIMKKLFGDWTKGQNIYAALCRANGRPVETIRIVAMMNNWAKGELYKPDYPPAPIQMIDLDVWPQEQAMEFIEKRVLNLIDAENIEEVVHAEATKNRAPDMNDDDFNEMVQRMADKVLQVKFPCSNEDMWQRLQDYAVIKPGAARATKTCETREEAEQHITEKGWEKTHHVEERWTKRTRCIDWCECANVCRQNLALNGVDPDAPAPLF